jgi:protein tyrosine phosphatase
MIIDKDNGCSWSRLNREWVCEKAHSKYETYNVNDSKKDRYYNILPYSFNRVRLDDDRYINASWIDHTFTGSKFIASQSPMDDTLYDFYSMIYDKDVDIVLMLTRHDEEVNGKRVEKSCRYLPIAKESKKNMYVYSDDGKTRILVKTLNMKKIVKNNENVLVITTLSISYKFCDGTKSPKKIVKHIFFGGWKDHGCPNMYDYEILINAYLEIRYDNMRDVEYTSKSIANFGYVSKGDEGITLVHCSAGCGRTGVFFTTLFIILQNMSIFLRGLNIHRGWNKDIDDTIKMLRRQRDHSVTHVDQYSFIKEFLSNYTLSYFMLNNKI